MSVVLRADSISKKFRIHQNNAVTLKESLVRKLKGQWDRDRFFWALRDVSFAVEEGHALGIVGHNGAGKSTLLRLLCGLGRPTMGRIISTGHVSGLLDLGSGFHPDMTGRENILTGGLLTGFTRRQVLAHIDEIISFSELEQFIDQPVRTYSSGMYLRLAFATAMQFEPTVLIIDEVLAVGDSRFQQKCIDRLVAFREAGKTLILTSHVPGQIAQLCDDVLVLEEGRVIMQGNPEDALRCYNDLMRQRTERQAAQLETVATPATIMTGAGTRQGTQEASIQTVNLYNEMGNLTTRIDSGDSLTIELQYVLSRPIQDMIVGLGIYNDAHVKCFEVTVPSAAQAFGSLAEQGSLICHIPALPLLPGRYFINVGLYPPNWEYVYDYHWQMHALVVIGDKTRDVEITGVLAVQPTWRVSACVEV